MVRPHCARQVPDAAAQRQAADAGGRDDAGRRRQAEGVRGVVHVAPGAAAVHAHGARRRIDADAFHARQVDHQAVVAGAQAAAVVPAAADGESQASARGRS